jgi:GNAT superfamily N-acetyltransferase
MTAIDDVERIALEAFRTFRVLPGARELDDERLAGLMTNVPMPFFSGIAMSDVTAADVPEIIERYKREQRHFRWWISPSTRPSGLAAILPLHGMRHTYDSAGMTADLAGVGQQVPLPEGCEIEHVRDMETLEVFFDVFAQGFQRDRAERQLWIGSYAPFGFEADAPWQYFVAKLHGEAVATTAVLDCGELAGIYHVATLPRSRGRGIGAAITRAAMSFAKERGARRAALQASKMGYNVYRALGFEDACSLSLYDWRPEYASS